jgi:CRP-like cAMP-binding protein
VLLSILEGGDVFGEMALLDDRPRSATVTAMETCELLVVERARSAPCSPPCRPWC